MAKLIRRENGIWYVRYEDDIESPEGQRRKQRFVSLGTKDQAEAKTLFKEIQTSLLDKKVRRRFAIASPVADVDELWRRFEGSYAASGLRPLTLKHYAQSVMRFLKFLRGSGRPPELEKITNSTMKEFLAYRTDGSSPTVADKDARHLKVVFKYAEREGIIPEGLFNGIQKRKAPRRLPQILNDEQTLALFRAADEVDREMEPPARRMGLFVRLGYYHGFRPGEICSLTMDAVDFENGVIAVQSVDDMDFVVKGGRERVVKLYPAVAQMIREMGPYPDGRYLVGYRNTWSTTWRRHWEKVRALSGLSAFEPKQLRKNFALRFIQLTQSEPLTRAMMGHSSDTNTLLKNYLHMREYFKYEPSNLWDKLWVEGLLRPMGR